MINKTKQLKEIAKAYSAPIDFKRSPSKYCNWDGEKINALKMTPDGVLHEIGHYILSTEAMRKLPDYGMGPGPDTNYEALNKRYLELGFKKPKYRYNDNMENELQTCTLEFIFAAMLNLDVAQIMLDTNYIYGYDDYDDNETYSWADSKKIFLKDIKALQAKKIIDKNWNPLDLNLNTSEKERIAKFKNIVCFEQKKKKAVKKNTMTDFEIS